MKTLLQLTLVLGLAVTLMGCPLIEPYLNTTHSLTVKNRCGSPNLLVNFHVDGTYQGSVYLSRTFSLPAGYHTLSAQGTGSGGINFTRGLNLDSDYEWTLCV
jgi:hypothetical protein